MWCNECAKDPFMFLLLSCFLNKEQVIEIMGENLLAKPSLSDTYRDMLGIKGIKPFECVGTPDEVKSAFILVHDRGEFESDVNMKMFVEEVLPTLLDPKALVVEIFARSGENAIPEEFMNLVSGL